MKVDRNSIGILAIHQSSDLYGSDRSFLSAIAALKTDGNNVDVILPKSGPLSEILKYDGFYVNYKEDGYLRKSILRNPLSFLKKSIITMFWYLKEYKKYDVIYINTIVCFSAILATIFSGKKSVIHVREIPTGFFLIFFKILLCLSNSKLIYNSKATEKVFNIKGDVIYNGVPVDDSIEILDYVDHSEKLKLLIVGRINAWKGQDFLLRSLLNLNRQVELRVVGDTISDQEYLIKDLESFCEDNLISIGHDVVFCGFSDNVSEHYCWCDYLVVPSIKPEPFGRVAIEALSYGKPVVAANCGGLSEIIDDKKNGFLFDFQSEESLSLVIDSLFFRNSIQYKNMRLNAKKTYQDAFSENIYQSNIKNFFKELI